MEIWHVDLKHKNNKQVPPPPIWPMIFHDFSKIFTVWNHSLANDLDHLDSLNPYLENSENPFF